MDAHAEQELHLGRRNHRRRDHVHRPVAPRCSEHALARQLVAAGIPDAPMAAAHRGLRGETTYRSFHEMALWTYEETATRPLHRVRWVDPAVRATRIAAAFGPKQGVKPSAATTAIPVLDAAD
jgi:hypothetical protein